MRQNAAVIPKLEAVRLEAGTTRRLTRTLAVVGGAGLAVSAAGIAVDRAQFFFSYLVAFTFCLSLALGALFFTLLQHLTASRWSIVVRRISETLMANFVVLLVLFIPLLFGLHDLFHWTQAEEVAKDHLLQVKAPYLNTTFLAIRLAIYFGAWVGISMYFYRKSIEVDETGDASLIQRLRKWSGPCILVYAVTQTFASIDLLMSLDPHWFSTIFGVYYFAGTTVTAFSIITLVALIFRAGGKLVFQISSEHYHDLGKLMFGFTVFWAYIAFSQYFLIWYGNIPEETVYLLHRWEGSWKAISLLLFIGHFVLPFAVLLSRHAKRKLGVLGVMAAWLVFMQLIDLQWLILPTLHQEGYRLHWLDITCLIGVAGVFSAAVVHRFGQQALVSVRDPLLVKSLEFENV